MGLTTYAHDTAFKITSNFEGWLAGNFDGQYMSYGYLQWNFGQGTLQPLFRRLFNEYPDVASSILPGEGISLKEALDAGTERDWALSVQSNGIIYTSWSDALWELYNTPEFGQIMDDAATWYIDRALSMCSAFQLKTVRAFALAFDLSVQNGGHDYYEMIETEYLDKLQSWITVAVQNTTGLIDGSNEKCKQDVFNRKMSILTGGTYGTKSLPDGVIVTDDPAFETEWIDWKTALNTISENGQLWIDGILAITEILKTNTNLWALQIFRYLPVLIEKIFNKRVGCESDYLSIITSLTSNPDEWLSGIATIKTMAEAEGDIGALEIFKYFEELIVKLYAWEV